jgi:hypothetical protein
MHDISENRSIGNGKVVELSRTRAAVTTSRMSH